MDKLTFLLAISLIAGCAAHPEPIVDTKGTDPEQFAADWAECEAYADQVVIGEGMGKGAAVGAVVGAAAGAISGRSDVGKGAASGALYGGTRSGLDADRDKQMVFKRCLRGRGYRVLN